MIIHEIEQRTPEWFALRVKYPLTASKAQAIGNCGAGLDTLCWEKKAEEYRTSERVEIDNEHLQRGRELEDQAIQRYTELYGTEVVPIGFVTDDKISKVGGVSPDGWTETHNIEVKCPADTKYFKLLAQYKAEGNITVESQYMWQMQDQMLFTGHTKSHYIVYNPNFEDDIIVIEVLEDKDMQDKIRAGLEKGEGILNEIDQKLGTAF